ncbi:MAG: ornithine carbamoyltransferase [Candidatus Methanospirareceae archaeon]
MRNIVSIFDVSFEEIGWIVKKAKELKKERQEGKKKRNDLEGKTLAMIFEKPSTRTRVSFEVAMHELGGHSLYLSWNDLQLGRGERIKETAKVLSSYVDAIMIRAFEHTTVEEFARYASVPVINGLSDLEHPCQILADIMTIEEHKEGLRGMKVAWIGDGNNVCNSLIGGCAITGMDISVACPQGYEPNGEVLKRAKKEGETKGVRIEICKEPKEAALDADVLYTDTWVSMGDEAEREKRVRDLARYQINKDLVSVAKDDAIVMHCMPAHIGEEITEDVMYSGKSVIFEQAENRLHVQKALLLRLIKD